jgi:histidinol-phosphate aminotransferase
VNRYWSDHVADLQPYTPGEQPKVADLLKLNTNEHPYGPSPRAIAAIKAATDDSLRLYPDYDASALREAIARLYSLEPGQVFLGNGSDEVLAHVFNALFRRQGRELLMPDVSYSFYRSYCRFYALPHTLVPLADDFSIRAADYTAPRPIAPAGIIFANPNAPTGIALALAEIEEIVRANPDCAVVVDEAYVDFGADSAAALLGRYENLVVIQTLSKSRSLAGLRVGFALASTGIIQALTRIKDSFNSYPLDRLAQVGALAAIEDTAYFEQTRRAVMSARDQLVAGLQTLGFEVLPTQTNFVFARHPDYPAIQLSRGLRDHNILVRHFTQARIDQFLRITVGTLDDCKRLHKVLAKLLQKP